MLLMFTLRFRLLIVLLVLGVCGVVAAQDAPAMGSSRHALRGTYIDEGSYMPALIVPAGMWTNVGNPVTLTCPGMSGTCTVQLDAFIQNGNGMSMGNQYQVCFCLDGMRVADCQVVGSTPSDGTLVIGAASELVKMVSPGTHMVQAVVWSMNGMSVFHYTSNYRVYKP
jgi:hypothetical protein